MRQLNRQRTLDSIYQVSMDDNKLSVKWQLSDEQMCGGYACLLSPAAIAAIIIASMSESSTSSCDNPGAYAIDLQIFLYVAGCIQIAHAVVYLCIRCFGHIYNVCMCVGYRSLLIFYLVWAGLGLYIYENQMGEECKTDEIGVMILIWSVIQYVFIGPVICCPLCCLCCVGTMHGVTRVNQFVSD
eukprot:308299_1